MVRPPHSEYSTASLHLVVDVEFLVVFFVGLNVVDVRDLVFVAGYVICE